MTTSHDWICFLLILIDNSFFLIFVFCILFWIVLFVLTIHIMHILHSSKMCSSLWFLRCITISSDVIWFVTIIVFSFTIWSKRSLWSSSLTLLIGISGWLSC